MKAAALYPCDDDESCDDFSSSRLANGRDLF
jgi:hypothetical protein